MTELGEVYIFIPFKHILHVIFVLFPKGGKSH